MGVLFWFSAAAETPESDAVTFNEWKSSFSQYALDKGITKENIFVEHEDTKKFRSGKLDMDLIYSELTDEKLNFYISGPKKMIDVFFSTLINKGVDKKNIFIDEWE